MSKSATPKCRLRLAFALLSFGLLTLGALGTRQSFAEESPLLYTGSDREQKLIAGAKAEGEVMLYSAMIVNQAIRPLADAFMKKYPFIKMNYWRAESRHFHQAIGRNESRESPGRCGRRHRCR